MAEDLKYKNFETYLKKYTGQKINCLIVGAYTGDYSCWLLNNLCTNHFSKVFSLENWIDPIIENKFDTNIESTNKNDYHVKLNMILTKGLVRLEKIKYVIFDIIIINTKNEDKDIISNSIIAWNLLNENGIMIFDNYRDTYEEEEFIPKISINSFIIMYKEQYNRLTSNYQLIIEKKSNIISKEKEQDIINIINNYNFESLYIKFDENIEEELEFRLANIELDSEMVKINEKIKIINTYYYKTLFNKININIQREIYNEIINYMNTYNIILSKKIILYYNYINFYCFFIKKNNYKHIFLNIEDLDKNKFNIIFSDIKFNHKFNISFNNIELTESIYIDNISNNKKYDLIYDNFIKTQDIKQYLYKIGFALNIQEKNGTLILYIPIIFNINIMNEIVILLQKYYTKITLKNRLSKFTGVYIIYKCKYFKGISQKELTQLNNLILELYRKDQQFIFNSILNINYTNNLINIKYKYNNKLLIYIIILIDIITKFNIIINTNSKFIFNLFINRLIYLYIINIYNII